MSDSSSRTALRTAIERLGDYLGSWVELQRVRTRCPGIQWAIAVGDETVASGASGLADATTATPLTEHHLFRIASHSKWFAATMIMQLFEHGRLRLDDRVDQYLAATSSTDVGALTIRELLGHQAGVIRDGQDCNYWQLVRPFPDVAEIYAMATSDDGGLTFATNEFFKYSNIGLSLIGQVIEAVTGRSFAEALAATITEPLGLAATGGEFAEARRSEFATGHTKPLDADDPIRAIPHVSTGAMAAATGCYSTACDMVRFGAAHVLGDERLLTDRSKRIIQRDESVVVVRDEEQGRYGLGVEIHRIGTRRLIGHSGGFPGFISRTFVDPAEGLVVSVLTNAVEGPAHETAVAIVKLIDLALQLSTAPAATTDLAREGIDTGRYAGRFLSLWGYQDIVAIGDRLVLLWPGAADPTSMYAELSVIDDDTLRIAREPGFASAGEVVRIHRDGSGRPVRADIGGMTFWEPERFRTVRPTLLGEEDP